MKNETNSQLVKGALLLTFAGFISKVLSAGYRIPLQNLTGDLGFYMYQQVYPFIALVMVLSLYSFPSAISKMASERYHSLTLHSFYLPIFLIMMFINGLLSLFIFLFAPLFSSWVGDIHLTRAYKLVAIAFLLIPFTSLFRGVFQAQYNMIPTAYSQVGEQLIRVSIIVLAAYAITTGRLSVYHIGEVAAFASIIGMIIATLILFVYFRKNLNTGIGEASIPWSYYLKTLIIFGLVASFQHLILISIQFADVITIVPALVEHGWSEIEAKEAKGVFDRGIPLIQLGTVIGSSFALAIIPAVAIQNKKALKEIGASILSGLKVCFYFASGATIGLITIFPEANQLLFEDVKGTMSLQILSLSILLSSIIITGSSILQSQNDFIRPACYIIGAFFIKWIGNLLFVPMWGITGSAVSTVVALLILTVLLYIELKKKVPGLSFLRRMNYKAFLKASVVMIGYLLLMKIIIHPELISTRLGLLLYVIWVVFTGGFIYIMLLIRSNVFTETELAMLPLSAIWTKLSKF